MCGLSGCEIAGLQGCVVHFYPMYFCFGFDSRNLIGQYSYIEYNRTGTITKTTTTTSGKKTNDNNTSNNHNNGAPQNVDRPRNNQNSSHVLHKNTNRLNIVHIITWI